MSARDDLRAHLEMLADAWGDRDGYAYRGPAGFVLEHGHWYEPTPDHGGLQPGAPKACFGNAMVVSATTRLPYVEGYAVADIAGGLVVHHAWNAGAPRLRGLSDPAAIDNTWPGPGGLAYLGVQFAVERADDCTWNGDASVLDDWLRGWPLLRERWTGEPADAVWSPSPRLDLLRRASVGARA